MMTVKVEVSRFSDGRLKLLVCFTKDKNVWIHEDESFSYVPTKSEIDLIKDALDAIDNYNIDKIMFDRSWNERVESRNVQKSK